MHKTTVTVHRDWTAQLSGTAPSVMTNGIAVHLTVMTQPSCLPSATPEWHLQHHPTAYFVLYMVCMEFAQARLASPIREGGRLLPFKSIRPTIPSWPGLTRSTVLGHSPCSCTSWLQYTHDDLSPRINVLDAYQSTSHSLSVFHRSSENDQPHLFKRALKQQGGMLNAADFGC